MQQSLKNGLFISAGPQTQFQFRRPIQMGAQARSFLPNRLNAKRGTTRQEARLHSFKNCHDEILYRVLYVHISINISQNFAISDAEDLEF